MESSQRTLELQEFDNPRRRKRIRRFENRLFDSAPLRERHELLHSVHSKSTQTNIKLAKRLIEKYATLKNANGLITVNKDSSVLVLNLLADYCRFGTPQALKNDSMGGVIQGLREVYCENGHNQTWSVHENGSAKGNPLIGKPDLDRLRRAHGVHLSRFGAVTIRARPITPEHICDIAEKFCYGNGNQPSATDIALHCVMVLGLNLGLRYDEISKLKIDNVTVWSGGITMTLCEAIKNSTVQRKYTVREWDGNSGLRHSLLMDPFVAVLSWLVIRGNTSGFLFCEIKSTKGGEALNVSRNWTCKSFRCVFQKRLSRIGVGRGDFEMFTGHSLKRGSVQLYRSLGLKDEMVMELIQMSGYNAYANYCEAYNDCTPKELPRFAAWEEYVSHARTLVMERNIVQNDIYFREWLKEMDLVEEEAQVWRSILGFANHELGVLLHSTAVSAMPCFWLA